MYQLRLKIKILYSTIRSWLYINIQYIFVKIGLKKYIYIDDKKAWREHFGVHFDQLQSLKRNSDIFISYTSYEDEYTKKTMHSFALDLSPKYRVVVYEVTPEIGGAGGSGLIEHLIAEQIQFLPAIEFVGKHTIEGIIEGAAFLAFVKGLNLIKSKKKKTPQFVIKRANGERSYYFIFDQLDSEIAVEAYKKIDSFRLTSKMGEDRYHKYSKRKKRWKQYEI